MRTITKTQTGEQLAAIRARVADLRDERRDLRATRDAAREKIAHGGVSDVKQLMASAEFKAGEKATARLEEVETELAQAERDERGIIGILGEGAAPGTLTDASLTGSQAGLTAEPGKWLSAVLSKRARDIPNLPDDARAMASLLAAVGDTGTTADYSTVAEGVAAIDLLAPASVALASGIGLIKIDKTEARIPRFAELPVAEWIAELAAFPKGGPGIERVDVKPPKVGLVAGLSLELFEDLSPLALSLVQTQILRAVALAYDHGMLFGSGTDDQPKGVANTTGAIVETGALDGLGVFSRAIAALLAHNATPRAVVVNPVDFGSLLELTELVSSGGQGTNSLVPLIRAAGGQGFELPYFPGLKWFLTPGAPQGTGVMYDPVTVAAVVRKQVDLSIDPYYGFDNGEVGLRCYIRGDVVVGQADGVCRLDFTP